MTMREMPSGEVTRNARLSSL